MNGIGLGRFNHEAPTILEAFETSLETLGRWWSHHRLGRGHWNQWGVLLGRPFWASSVVCFPMIFCVIVIFVSGNMWHFYVDVFFFVLLFWFRKKTGHVDVERDFWVVNWCWWKVWRWRVMTCVERLSGFTHTRGCWDIYLSISLYIYIFREGLATYIIPESSFFNF